MKKLYLLRHADAAPMKHGQKDSQRPLTDRGRKQAAEVAAEAKLKMFSVDLILTSPYARALDTARIFAAVYEMQGQVIEEPLLECGCSVQEIRKILTRYEDCESILCVGHEPDFGVIAAALLGQKTSWPFHKAECREIDLSNGLRFLLEDAPGD